MTFPALRDLVEDLRHARPALWAGRSEGARSTHSIDAAQVQQAVQRFERFAPLLAQLFPELQASGGRIESALLHVPRRAGREPKLWNYAADIVINGMILREGFSLPEGGLRDVTREHLSTE